MGPLGRVGPFTAVFDVHDYGAVGDGRAVETAVIQQAIDACGRAGGGTVHFPAGSYRTGALSLHSHVTLHIGAGASLVGSQDPQDYPAVPGRWEGVPQTTHAPLIGGTGLEHVAVIGQGIIDGQGEVWWKMHCADRLTFPRPRLISFKDCRNVLIQGITAINSPSWTVSPLCCENVTIDGITIVNPPDSPNTDGINPDSCRNVRIANCHIDVGDDCLTLKSGAETGDRARLQPCENITITNCTMAHGHGAVVIGSEMSGDVRNVVISNCVFDGTDRGIRIKSRRGRGGLVEDIRASNIIMKGVLCPFTINLHYAIGASGDEVVNDRGPRPLSDGTPRIRHVHLSQITARGVKVAAGFVYGLAEMPLHDISLSDVSMTMSPDGSADYPEMAEDLEPMQRAGLYLHNVERLRLHNIEIAGQLGPAISITDATEIDLSALASASADGGSPVVQLKDVRGAFVHACRACTDTSVFLRVAGPASKEICLGANHLGRAARAVELDEDAPPESILGWPERDRTDATSCPGEE